MRNTINAMIYIKCHLLYERIFSYSFSLVSCIYGVTRYFSLKTNAYDNNYCCSVARAVTTTNACENDYFIKKYLTQQ